jgi:hypothetical protein
VRLDVSFPASVHRAPYPPDFLREAAVEFPKPDDPRWHVFQGEHEPQKRQGGPDTWGPCTTQIMVDLMSARFAHDVAHAIGHEGILYPDVYGGGLHLSGPGARLDTHVDFNRHPHMGWRRKANVLLYLNEDWQPEWGGCLELDRGAATIPPTMGTLVVFETSDRSWHGHPEPITDGHWRKSLAVYFYDVADVVTVGEAHDTTWAGEPGT